MKNSKRAVFFLILALICTVVSPTFAYFKDGSQTTVSVNPLTLSVDDTMTFTHSAGQERFTFFMKSPSEFYYDMKIDVSGIGTTLITVNNFTDNLAERLSASGNQSISLYACLAPQPQNTTYLYYGITLQNTQPASIQISFVKTIARAEKIIFDEQTSFNEIKVEKSTGADVEALVDGALAEIDYNAYTSRLTLINPQAAAGKTLTLRLPSTITHAKLFVAASLSLNSINLVSLDITTTKTLLAESCKLDNIRIVNNATDGYTRLNLLQPYQSAAIQSIDITSPAADVIMVAGNTEVVNITGNNIVHTVCAFTSITSFYFQGRSCTNVIVNITRPDNSVTVTGAQVLENNIPAGNPLRPIVITADKILNVKIALY